MKPAGDTSGTAHRDAVAALVKPMIDAQISTGIVVGLYDAGKTEIYGFGKGPDGNPPTGDVTFNERFCQSAVDLSLCGRPPRQSYRRSLGGRRWLYMLCPGAP